MNLGRSLSKMRQPRSFPAKSLSRLHLTGDRDGTFHHKYQLSDRGNHSWNYSPNHRYHWRNRIHITMPAFSLSPNSPKPDFDNYHQKPLPEDLEEQDTLLQKNVPGSLWSKPRRGIAYANLVAVALFLFTCLLYTS